MGCTTGYHPGGVPVRVSLGEIVLDFYDKLKSLSRGLRLARLRDGGLPRVHLVKLDMLINGDPIDAFSVIIHRDKAGSTAARWPRS